MLHVYIHIHIHKYYVCVVQTPPKYNFVFAMCLLKAPEARHKPTVSFRFQRYPPQFILATHSTNIRQPIVLFFNS